MGEVVATLDVMDRNLMVDWTGTRCEPTSAHVTLRLTAAKGPAASGDVHFYTDLDTALRVVGADGGHLRVQVVLDDGGGE